MRYPFLLNKTSSPNTVTREVSFVLERGKKNMIASIKAVMSFLQHSDVNWGSFEKCWHVFKHEGKYFLKCKKCLFKYLRARLWKKLI